MTMREFGKAVQAVACRRSWYTLFLLPRLAAANNAPRRPIQCLLHRLFPLILYAFVLTLYSAAVWQSHAHPATILLVASSLATLGILYLTNQMQAAPGGNAVLYRRRLRISISMLALLLNFIFVGMCMFPINPAAKAAVELALIIKSSISWILSHHLGERASSILNTSFNTISQLLNGDSVKVILLTASNLSLLGFLTYVTRPQAERSVEGRSPDRKGRLMTMASLIFSCLCFVRAPPDGIPASRKAPTCARGQRLCPHHHQHQKQFPRKLGLNPLPVNPGYLALPRGRRCCLVDFRLADLAPRKTPASRKKLERGYGDATSRRYSRLQAQHSKHPPTPRHHYKICAYKRH